MGDRGGYNVNIGLCVYRRLLRLECFENFYGLTFLGTFDSSAHVLSTVPLTSIYEPSAV